MLTFATLNWRNYQGRGVEYSNVLYDAVTRNLAEGTEGRFVVFTDDVSPDQGYHPAIILREIPQSDLKGWWNKLALFHPDAFDAGDRVIFFDLDTLPVGPLDDLVKYKGSFAILRDAYRVAGLQSSVMMWEAGCCEYIWRAFLRQGFPELGGGDQEFIERTVKSPVILQDIYPRKFTSYKRDARYGIPEGCSVVFFHGLPRPHQIEDGWVPMLWKVGAGTASQLELVGNTDSDTIAKNIRRAESDPNATWLKPLKPHDKVAVICAGGPSLKDEMPSIMAHAKSGAHIFACNGVPKTLRTFGITTDLHVVLDARPENAAFLEGLSWHTVCLYASQCDRKVHEGAEDRLVLWHPAFPGVLDIVGADKERTYIGGGTTCGMKSATLAWTLGYREIHLYGFDSCYRGDDHHAYPQSLNDGEQVLDVQYNGKSYRCSPWMIQQAEDFETVVPQLMDHGARVYVHGTGLIPDMAAQLANGFFRPESADFRAHEILEKLKDVAAPNVAEVGVFAGDLSRRLLARRPDLKLTMIDKWDTEQTPAFSQSGDWHLTLNQEQQDGYYHLAQTVTSFAEDRRKVIRADSKDAASQIPDESLDLAFIDADHSYEGCKTDIQAYWPKVKPGGVLAGHDYANDEFKFGPMVKKAVDEFAAAQGLDLELGSNYTWFATKPQDLPHV